MVKMSICFSFIEVFVGSGFSATQLLLSLVLDWGGHGGGSLGSVLVSGNLRISGCMLVHVLFPFTPLSALIVFFFFSLVVIFLWSLFFHGVVDWGPGHVVTLGVA